MFFLELVYKQLPQEMRNKLDSLYIKDREIFKKNKEGKNIDLDVINFMINALTIFLDYNKKVNKKIRDDLTEGIGAIPITFFDADDLKVSKDIEETTEFLRDIIDAHANLHINREKLIRDVLKKFRKLKEKYKEKNAT